MHDIGQAFLRKSGVVPALRSHLDDLAATVADALERGDEIGAWAVTSALERVLDPAWRLEPRPPWPVIARRFAAAHRRLLLAAADGDPDAMAVLAVTAPRALVEPVPLRRAPRRRLRQRTQLKTAGS